MKKIILIVLLLCTVSNADSKPSFFQQDDKQAHIAITILLGIIGNGVAGKLGASPKEAFWYGLGTALVVGISKEVYDMHKTNPTGFDMQDILADSIGGTIGTGSITLVRFNSGGW